MACTGFKINGALTISAREADLAGLMRCFIMIIRRYEKIGYLGKDFRGDKDFR